MNKIIDNVIDEIVCEVESEFKRCNKCGITKMKSEFNEDKAKKDGYKGKCKGCIAKYNASYRQDNKETLAKKKAIYIQDNKEVIAKRNAIWRQDNKEAIAKQRASYRQENKEAIDIKNNGYRRKRRQTDEGYRIGQNLRSRMRQVMNGTKKSERGMKLIGLESGTEIHEYLAFINPELKDVKCDIDHRLPCSMYDLTMPEHQKACFHYTNLQWLIPQVNRNDKRDKYPPELKPELDERGKFKKDSPTVLKQLSLISHIESHKLTFKQVVELQRAGNLYEVVGCDI